MPESGGARLALEAGFLLIVAAVLAAGEVATTWVVVVMAVAWLLVVLFEWAAWRQRPHWSSGEPPRYRLPEDGLPPRPPSRSSGR